MAICRPRLPAKRLSLVFSRVRSPFRLDDTRGFASIAICTFGPMGYACYATDLSSVVSLCQKRVTLYLASYAKKG